MEEPKKAVEAKSVIGKCIPELPADALFRFLESVHEIYVCTDSLILLGFKGQVRDGAVLIPQHAQYALDGKEAFVGILWAPKLRLPEEAKPAEGSE